MGSATAPVIVRSQTQITKIEWPTVALLVAFFVALASVIGWQDSIPWPLEILAYIYLGGLWMSLGHELLHGHPTPWTSLNTAIGFIPPR